jgi:hypothetical protein
MKLSALMAVFALAGVLISSAAAENRTIELWNYNVTLDGIGENVTFQPMTASSDVNSIVRSIRFQGQSALDWGVLSLYEHRNPSNIILEDLLRQVMIGSCKAIRANPGSVGNISGMVASADARVEHGFGQKCWGGAVQAPGGETGVTKAFTILAHFRNETLNEHLVKTARIVHK